MKLRITLSKLSNSNTMATRTKLQSCSEAVWVIVGQACRSSQAESAQSDNVGNGVSGRVRPDETPHGQIPQAYWPLLLENFIFSGRKP